MHYLTVTGASDDLIEIAGSDITEEFNVMDPDDEAPAFIAISDGTLLRVIYDDEGTWRVTLIAKGRAVMSKVEGSTIDDTFDLVRLESDTPFSWVVCGDHKALAS